MEKIKVFVSVPMKGRDDAEIKKDIEMAKKHIFGDSRFAHSEVDIIHNYIDKPEGSERLYCLGEAIKKLGDCDYIFMCPGWNNSHGCWIEKEVADHYNIKSFGFLQTSGKLVTTVDGYWYKA